MSMRRVSSRPRLVSDADRASQISALDTTENDTNSSSYFLFGQDGDDDDDGNHDSYAEVTLFGEEEERRSVLPAALITGNDEKKSHVVTTRRTSSSSTANDKKLMMSSSISDDTLSDYASCCLYQDEDTTTTTAATANTTLNSLRRESNPSLTNLEMSFQKTSLSSNEDEGGMEAAAAAAVAYIDRQLTTSTSSSTSNNNTASCCTKRKRLSQQQQQQHSYYYLTPNSSYAELQQSAHTNNMMWYSPLSTKCASSPVRVVVGGAASANSIPMMKQPYYQHHPSTTTSSFANTFTTCAPPPTITLLPEETLINIAIHLPHNDIRSLGSTCHSIRMVLMRSTCAMEMLWMERLRCRFPVVFGLQEEDASNNSSNNSNSGSDGGGSRMMHSSNINFVDEFELPLAAARTGFVGVYDNVTNTNSSNNINNCRNTVNLPLLIGLLAPRYPQMINLHGDDLRASFGSGGGSVPFRSFDMTVPRATTATVASPMMIDEERDDDVVVSVIQFTGTVGTGDRSIRSDKPFPPNCRSIASSSNNSGSSSSSSSSHGSGTSFKSLSTWMKNHTPLRSSRGNKRKNGRASQQPTHSMVRDLSPPPTPRRYNNRHFLLTTVPNSNSNLNLPLHSRRGPLQHLPFTSSHSSRSQRSPLFRFLSSLSHHCDCVNDSNASSLVDNDNDADDLDDIVEQNRNDDDDEIGVNDYGMMIRHNGNGLLEQCRQKLGYNNKSVENNLRPFVIPTVLSSSSPGEGGVTVDVTPGLVAYFEVTIMDQRDEASRTNESNERHVPQQQQQQPPQHHHARLPHRGYNLPRPLRRRNVPLGGHRLLFLQHAQNRLLAGQAAAVALNNNVGQQPPPQQQQQRLHHHDFNDNAPANIRRPHHRQQRHECVAIGLSTLSFNPRSRMPGWDEHSFGYHGDDGGIFHGHGDMLRRYGPSFGPGDTIGCGLDYSTRKIFFVKNGEFLGWAFDNVDKEMVDRGLYPTVGVDTECPVHVNFGKSPFKFDLKEFGREKLYL